MTAKSPIAALAAIAAICRDRSGDARQALLKVQELADATLEAIAPDAMKAAKRSGA